MTIDQAFEHANGYLQRNIPFLIYKPDFNSFDQTVPLLARRHHLKLIKLGMHNLGNIVKEHDALAFAKQVLTYPIDTPTIVWVEDISTIDDKAAFVAKVIEAAAKNSNIRLIFTGIEKHCAYAKLTLPIVYWDENYGIFDYEHTYVTPNQCYTIIMAPQPLHFRVYCNIIYEVTKALPAIPKTRLETSTHLVAELNSIIQCALLAVHKGEPVCISTDEPFSKHKLLTDAIMYGWSKPVPAIFVGDINGEDCGISTLG